jgi:hypothetical protein
LCIGGPGCEAERAKDGFAVTSQAEPDELTPVTAGLGRYRSRLLGLSCWLRATLFPPPAGQRPTWRQALAAVALVAVGATVSLARTSGPGALNTTWIEDADNFLQDALHQSVLTTLTTQVNGYYELVPRLVTAVAVVFPLSWAPGIMSACAATGYAVFGLIAYIASGPFLHRPWLRLLVAAPACVVPLGYTQANNDLATVQFIALYGMFWLLLWRPVTRAGQLLAPLIMLGTTFSSFLPALLAPLLAARLIADRSKTAVAVAVCWAAGLVAQWSVQLRGLSNRKGQLYTSPLWVLGQYFTRVVPRAVFGERALGGPGTNGEGHPLPLTTPDVALHDALVWGACAIVVLVVALALARRTAPTWPLAVTAVAFSVVLFLGEIVDNLPIVQPRYVIAPALLLYTAIVAMLCPKSAAESQRRPWPAVATWIPVTAFALLLAVVVGFNFRVINNRSESPPWTAVVATATNTCQQPGMVDYDYRHAWWRLQIPCTRVRSS